MRRLLRIMTFVGLALITASAGAQYTSSSGTFGSRTLGNTLSAGTRTFSAGATTSTTDTAGQITGSERFLRQNHQAGNFIGTDSTEAAYALRNFSIYGTTAAARRQQALGSLRNAAASAIQQRAAQAATTPPFQTAIVAAFAHPEPAAHSIPQNLVRHVQEAIKTTRPLQVAVEGDTTILRGAVRSAHERALIEQLARLEPGVRKVKNELTVTPPASRP